MRTPIPIARRAAIALLLAAPIAAQQDPAPAATDPGAALKAVIDRGHAWLRRHQDDDGRFSASTFCVHDPKGAPCDGPGKPDQDVLVTSFVIKACYGIGQLPNDPANDHVVRAAAWLASQVQADGSIGAPSSRTRVRDTAVAANALRSAHQYGHPEDVAAKLDTTARWLDAQRDANGLWPANPGGEPDWIATTLALEFLSQQDGRAPTEALPRLVALDDHDVRGGHAGATYLAAWFVRDADVRADTCCRLAQRRQALCQPLADRDPLVWFWASQAMQFDDAPGRWRSWWTALVDLATASQRSDAAFDGSWDPTGPLAREGGRVYATAVTLLALEVIWRKEYRDK